MPRPKGSKNKKTTSIPSLAAIQEQIETVAGEIESITAEIKTKKAFLKQLQKDLAVAKEMAEMKKAEEEMAAILKAVKESDKSVDEIIEFLMG